MADTPTEGHAPGPEALKAALATATTGEAAKYYAERLSAIVEGRKGPKELRPFVSTVHQYADARLREEDNAGLNAWDGIYERPSAGAHKTIHQVMDESVANSVSALPESAQDVKLSMDFSEDGTFVRGYLVDGQDITPETESYEKAMDSMLHDWFVHHDLHCKGQIMYETDALNKIKLDDDGNPIRADISALKEKLASETDGIQAFIESRGEGRVTLTTLDVKVPAAQAAEVEPENIQAPPAQEQPEQEQPEQEEPEQPMPGD